MRQSTAHVQHEHIHWRESTTTRCRRVQPPCCAIYKYHILGRNGRCSRQTVHYPTSTGRILYVIIEDTLVLYSRHHKNSTRRNSTLTPLIFIKTDIYIANWNTLMSPFTHCVHRTAQFMLTYNPVLHILDTSHSVIHYFSRKSASLMGVMNMQYVKVNGDLKIARV
jgi:hypothetical protein